MEWVGYPGVSTGKEEGAGPLRCQFSPRMPSPGGVGEGGLLPARTAILEPESNPIRRSPQSPQQLRRTAVWAGTSLPAPHRSLRAARRGCGLRGKGEEEGKGFGAESKTWAKTLRRRPPTGAVLPGGGGWPLCASVGGAPDNGKEITPEALPCTLFLL